MKEDEKKTEEKKSNENVKSIKPIFEKLIILKILKPSHKNLYSSKKTHTIQLNVFF